MAYAPPAAPVVFRAGYGFPLSVFVDDQLALYVATTLVPAQRAKLFEIAPDAGFAERYSYESPSASSARIIGDATSLFFTAYDLTAPGKGVVHRLPRLAGGTPCDLGGTVNDRPYGIHADPTHVYWTNQGTGAAPPYDNGSVVSCERSGCCTVPDVMWTGSGGPTGITGDTTALYFVTASSGTIWKIAKP